MKWLIQPVKVEQDKIDTLCHMLEQAGIAYDLVYPLKGQIFNADKSPYVFDDKETYFTCGSYPLTRYVHAIKPEAVFSLEDYSVKDLMNIFGKENFVNHDAQVVHTKDIVWHDKELFVRPAQDDKAFNGGIYNQNTLKYEGEVIVAPLKNISKEHRFFVIDGEVVTGSLYKINGQLHSSSLVDQGALQFAQEMAKLFAEPGFVIDIATIGQNYKIMELNCLNASGFYDISLYKLICAVEDHYSQQLTSKLKL